MPDQPTALKIPCPWSGDDNDPIPWIYRPWFRLYRTTRRLRHLLGLHDWSPFVHATAPPSRCSWCGATKARS